jgi:DNA-directed RNA polymerase specialized sigma24 family protein
MAAATAGISKWRLRLSMTANNHEAASAAKSGPGADRAMQELYLTQYRSLVRLAALLVGDVGTAEEIVQDSFVTMYAAWRRVRNPETALSYLRQDLVRRSRAAGRHQAPPGVGEPPAKPAKQSKQSGHAEQPGPAEQSAVLAAMRLLPNGQREALVLLLYLNLPEEQAAAAMGVSRRAMQEHAARGRAALQGVL